MFKICALNESSSEAESDTEQNQVETKEAQEAHLLDLYNSALQQLVKNNKAGAKTNLLEITNSSLFQSGEGSEQIQKTLRYNVHKNLGECFMDESDFQKAEDHFFEASQIDRTDVTLWFQLASASVKLGNFCMVRGALEEGLNCSPNHWPCLENLITVSFKLCDNFGCLCYCAMALERDPTNQKAIEYKSKVYMEMPFMQEYMKDEDFVPIPVERETYYYLPPEEPPRPMLEAPLESLTLEGLGEFLLVIYEKHVGTEAIISLVDNAKVLEDYKTKTKEREEAKIKVSVQNLVEEMMDIVECGEKGEEGVEICETIVDEILCGMFGVRPLTEEEKVVKALVLELVSESVEKGVAPTIRKKSVILPPKTKKKHFSIFDEIPEELLEKRRSCRNVLASQPTSLAASTDTSCDVGASKASSTTQRDLLTSYLPATLLTTSSSPKAVSSLSPPEPSSVKKSIFAPKPTKPWIGEEEEANMVTEFLNTNSGHPTDLMRAYLGVMYLLDFNMPWSRSLVVLVATVYKTWRIHWGYELEHEKPEEHLTMECLRYYIQGNECLLVVHQEEEATEMTEFLKQQMWKDLNDLNLMFSCLPLELKVRIRSLRFHYFMLIGDEEEVEWETRYLTDLYEQFPEVVVYHPITQYKMVTSQFLTNYKNNLSKVKELEELNQYYDDQKYQEIVTLLSETLDNSSIMTPSKDCSKTPNKETQIDIFIESLYYCKQYQRCLVWLEAAFNSELVKVLTFTEEDTGDIKEVTKQQWDTLDSYLSLMENCLLGLDTEKTIAHQFGSLPLSSAARLAQNLLTIILRQIEDPTNPELCYSSTLPWVLLHKLMVWQEKLVLPPTPSVPDRPPSPDSCIDLDAELPGSLSLLCSAHNYLGQKAACTMEHGKLLNYLVDIFVPILTTYPLPDYSEHVKTALEQAVFCLYAHPSKKSKARNLTDHNVSQLGLTWPRALVLYRYVKPAKLPEHDDVKTLSINMDTENLLRRIVSLVPDSVHVEKRKQVAMDYLTGKTKKMRKLSKLKTLPEEARDLFYLLADYAFKSNSDMENAIKYYAIDLTFNRERFDSWAALALSQGSKMDLKLNGCQLLVPQKMLSEIESVEMCYKECLRINDKNSNLWIEFGNFCYGIHSYISRTLNNNSENLNFETFEKLEKKKEEFLKLALQNYEKTLEIFERDGIHENDVDERWLLLFMIGKIKEKQGMELTSCLDFYIKSIGFLRKNEITMPRKINYNNPQDFSIEALEVYYRIHASILKTIAKAEKEKKEVPEDICRKFYEVLKTTQLDEIYTTNSPQNKVERFSNKRKQAKVDDDKGNKMTRQDETSTTIMRDVLEVVDTMIDDIEFTNNSTKYSMDNLAKLCMSGLEDVVFHFFHHFKALYRMAHFYHTSPSMKNLVKVRQLLLAGLTDKSASCPGLFGGRKPNLIFNEVWRIPVTEIDRPGSFANHCGKALILLLDVLKGIPDVATLVDISVQLRKPPSEENKFLHESDRQEIVTVASTFLNTALRTIREKMNIDKERKKPVETLEVYKLYQKLAKMWPGKEKDIFVHLRDMYAVIKNKEAEKEKITESEVLRFCTSETARLRALANPKPNTVTQRTGGQTGAVTSSMVGANMSAGGDKEAASLASWQQWGQILADQQRMLQFQSLLAMSSALPNMTPKDMAAFCGLGPSDLAGLAAYTTNISSLTPSSLASMGITSSQLSSLAQIASLTGANPQTIAAQANKQAQFEQEYLRHLIGGAASSSLSTTPTHQKPQVSQKPNITPKQGQKVTASSLPVKQTVQFKNKLQQQQVVQKKNLTKVVGLSSKPSSPTLSSVAHKLNSSGVTITKPTTNPPTQVTKPSPSIPKAQARNTPSPVVRSSLPQGISITKQPKNPNLAKKFPHLNITNVDQPPTTSLQSKSAGPSSMSPKPGLTVKPSSQLLKPAASLAQIQKTQHQKQPAAADAKNKLALFKAQMKKTLNVPAVTKKTPQAAAGPSRPNTANKQAAAGKKKVQPKPKPSGEDCEVICIDID
eukprot:TRINITY_DN21726_c0_g1_i3.p1 TRINITY_DN21726_c0_g1~~TRINITY_DN21726_c0_g1_i3.p1  ORF type:complete len:2006 (+),score=827.87 TRINITY_DN21726_c0_g1_i3:94-6111(+)